MRILVITLLIACSWPVRLRADTNAPATNAVAAVPKAAPVAEQIEAEYQKLLADDDAAQAEVDRWIEENQRFAAQGGGVSQEDMRLRIEGRFAAVRKAYENFLQRHPDHARARLAFGSFLNDLGEEDSAVAQWEKARELDPKNPAAWDNLANHYAHRGPVEKAFEYYARAMELNPREPLYPHSLGTCVYLFRRDATNYYHLLSEQQVFDKALELYAQAQSLDPTNFVLATDIAQTYYGITPARTEAALKAWNTALKLAGDELERQGVFLHLARVQLSVGRFSEARRYLEAVTDAKCADLKQRLLRNLEEKQAAAAGTNRPPAVVQP